MRAKVDIEDHSRLRAMGTQIQRRWPRTAIDSTRATRLVTVNVTKAAVPRSTNTTRAQFRWRPGTGDESDACGELSAMAARWSSTMPSPSCSGDTTQGVVGTSTVLATSMTADPARPQSAEPGGDGDASIRRIGWPVSHDFLHSFPYYLLRARDADEHFATERAGDEESRTPS